ncbi:ABC transporter ATP-binding protein [Plantactinospora sp. S1510]|uniref:ABC transporter ATP-binding protein n=1 Tax=Plantactinospora alkalitolerans TaxID=2789879 RepID=A0ABS0H5M5_9ACTN|nr:ABC transporter ATP-binding protein [Plantactinospora alkalitolerans]MBF9133790.1 ABC transporter ATP-binding protein [Plantactinospora alkalitolerans]
MSVAKEVGTDQLPWGRLRILWSFARPHTGKLILGLFLALLGSAAGLASPMVTKWVLDSLGGSASLSGPITALAVLLVLGSAIWLWQWILLGTLGQRIVLDARESIIRRLFRATVPEVARRPTGELVARVTSDTVLLHQAASSSIIGLINGTVMMVGTLVLMGVLDLVLLGTTVGAVIVVALMFAVLMPSIAKAYERSQEHLGRLGGVLEGGLRAIRTVKASRAEHRQSERIVAEARQVARFNVHAARREAMAWTIVWSGIQLAIILILGIGAWRVGEGELEVSSLIAFLLYAFGLMGPITDVSQNVTALQSGLAAAVRIGQVADIDVEAPDTGAAVRVDGRRPGADPTDGGQPRPGPVLELRGVSARYGPDAAPAVSGIDLTIPRRGHTAIVGPSGAGKTTLFSLILRFLEPQEGEIRLDGRPYREHTHGEIRQRLAYVEQESPVVPGTIGENLLFTYPDATEEEIRDVLAQVRLTSKIDALPEGLDTPLTSSSVSGGERQRIALARAILRTPDVLLLDEATAQIDGLTEAAIHEVIRDRAARGAVVTVAHRLSTVIDADTIVVMEAGRVRARGSHEELLAADDLYRRLVEALRITGASNAEGSSDAEGSPDADGAPQAARTVVAGTATR